MAKTATLLLSLGTIICGLGYVTVAGAVRHAAGHSSSKQSGSSLRRPSHSKPPIRHAAGHSSSKQSGSSLRRPSHSKPPRNVMCYYGTWATYRPSNGKFDVEDIDTSLCTHLIYAFAGIYENGSIRSLDPELDLPSGKNGYNRFTGLKQKNKDLKTILAVGGWGEGSANYSIMVGDPELRQNFIKTSLEFLKTYNFDGLDMDWDYPNQRDTVNGKADVENFSTLLKELKEAFKPKGYQLSAAVASVKASASLSYDIPAISEYVDFIHVMTYDLYGPWNSTTGFNSPLHKSQAYDDVATQDYDSVDTAIDYWLSSGASLEKISVGVPFYGHSWTLADPKNNSIRAPASGPGPAYPYTQAAGTIGYHEVCEQLNSAPWDVRFDDKAKVPYASYEKTWISFDNAQSLKEKVNWALQQKITNIFIWSIETDDFHGLCGEPFPLLKAINQALGRKIERKNREIVALRPDDDYLYARVG